MTLGMLYIFLKPFFATHVDVTFVVDRKLVKLDSVGVRVDTGKV